MRRNPAPTQGAGGSGPLWRVRFKLMWSRLNGYPLSWVRSNRRRAIPGHPGWVGHAGRRGRAVRFARSMRSRLEFLPAPPAGNFAQSRRSRFGSTRCTGSGSISWSSSGPRIVLPHLRPVLLKMAAMLAF